MAAMLALFDSMWNLMWLPLQLFSLDNILITCPLLLLMVTMLFGSFFKLFRGF